jgi:hypothetical protein
MCPEESLLLDHYSGGLSDNADVTAFPRLEVAGPRPGSWLSL